MNAHYRTATGLGMIPISFLKFFVVDSAKKNKLSAAE